MGLGATAPITIWAVSDGRAGNEAQVMGLAEAVARRRPSALLVKRIAWRGLTRALPARVNLFPRQVPGRASLALSIRVKRWSAGRTFVVQLHDPRLPSSLFDLVIPPRHDRLRGDNVLPMLGSPNRVTPERLRSDYARFAPELDALPHPRVAVLIGGRSKAHDIGLKCAASMGRDIERAVVDAGGSVMVTFSRRTPAEARDLLASHLRRLPGRVWDGDGDNPYFAFLAAADHILVTEDSTNLATEAAATGTPVLVMRVDGESRKLSAFHDDLRAHGIARPFHGALEDWTYAPLDETSRAAGAVLARMETVAR